MPNHKSILLYAELYSYSIESRFEKSLIVIQILMRHADKMAAPPPCKEDKGTAKRLFSSQRREPAEDWQSPSTTASYFDFTMRSTAIGRLSVSRIVIM